MKKYQMVGLVNDFFRRFGFQISGYGPSNPIFQSRQALLDPAVLTVIDVGANIGQYAKQVRLLRRDVQIHSFEPQKRAFSALSEQAKNDPLWQCHHVALGAVANEMEMQISENDQCSSLLKVEETHLKAAPSSRIVGHEIVKVKPLDWFLGDNPEVKFLKMDCQGYEAEVLRGATQVLKSTRYVQVEASLVPLYTGAPTVAELLTLFDEFEFEPLTIIPGFSDRQQARMLQVDIVFRRQEYSI